MKYTIKEILNEKESIIKIFEILKENGIDIIDVEGSFVILKDNNKIGEIKYWDINQEIK